MKTNVIFSAILALTVIFTSCSKDEMFITPSSNVTTVTKSVQAFSSLEVSDAFQVYVSITDGDEQVRIEANENLQSHIIVESRNGGLSIRMEDRISIRRREAVLNLFISVKQINELKGSGATNFHMQDVVTGQYVDVTLGGASTLSGTFQVQDLNARLDGASQLDIQGAAETFTVTNNGASEMHDFGFETQYLNARLDGASNISLTVMQRLDVKAGGASVVYFKGDGLIGNQDLSGASRIIRLD